MSLALVRGIHQWLVDSPHKGPVMQKMFPSVDNVIMYQAIIWANADIPLTGLQWNFNQYNQIFSQDKNIFENVVCKMAAISFLSLWINNGNKKH